MSRLGHGLWACVIFALVFACLPVRQAGAVMVATTMGNTTAPVDDFGFANVGVKSDGATGVYLGYRWVLTAAHVAATNITLNGHLYQVEEGTSTYVTNPTGQDLSTYADLRLYQITEDPWLPTLKIAEGTMGPWDEVIMVGHGQNRATTLKAWEITGDYPGAGEWTWTETDWPGGDAHGYLMGSGRTTRWGTNRVEPGMYAMDIDGRDTLIFWTDFDEFGGTDFEAQASIGDSGGGVFHKNGDQWELVGAIHAVNDFLPNQPGYCIFDSETYCSDLSAYRDAILAIIRPLAGDANLDKVVNEADTAILAANWGLTEGVLWGHGDFNEDGAVNAADAAILAANWGATSTTTPGQAETARPIPEPSTIGLILTGLVGFLTSLLSSRKRVL